MNEATLPTFTCSASSNHENIIHELTKYYSTTNILPPENYPLYGVHKTHTHLKRSSDSGWFGSLQVPIAHLPLVLTSLPIGPREKRNLI